MHWGVIILFSFFAVCLMGAPWAAAEPTGSLVVEISGFPSSDGFAMVALHGSEQSYKSDKGSDVAMTRVRLAGNKVRVVFANLAYGWYGISVYHDENGNEKLDKNAMGIPKEAYGFSNNAKGMFGKPGYKDVKFQIETPEKQITINMD